MGTFRHSKTKELQRSFLFPSVLLLRWNDALCCYNISPSVLLKNQESSHFLCGIKRFTLKWRNSKSWNEIRFLFIFVDPFINCCITMRNRKGRLLFRERSRSIWMRWDHSDKTHQNYFLNENNNYYNGYIPLISQTVISTEIFDRRDHNSM